MYEQEAIELIKTKVAFMGTVDEGHPHVRPMTPYLDDNGRIWLFCPKDSNKAREIKANNRVELCFMGEGEEFLRISGILDEDPKMNETEFVIFKYRMSRQTPFMQKYFLQPDDPNLMVYRMRVRHVQYSTKDATVTSQVNLPHEDDPDILFGSHGGFFMS